MNSKISVKDQIAIYIKKQKPLNYIVISGLCIVLIIVSCLIDVFLTEEAIKAPAALTTSKVQLRMTFTGDIEISDITRDYANKVGYSHLLDSISSYIKDSDYVISNISGPVLRYEKNHYKSTRSKTQNSYYLRPAALRALAKDIDVFSFANDDAYNYGTTGINTTISLLEEYQNDYLGIISDNAQDIYTIKEYTYKNEAGVESIKRVAIFSINDVIRDHSSPGTNKAGIINSSMNNLYLNISNVSKNVDHCIAYVHLSEGNSIYPTQDEQEIAYALIDAGVDTVIGNSSSLKIAEQYNDGVILYGLGSLISDEVYSYYLDGVLADFVVRNSGEIVLYLTPTHIENEQVSIASSNLYKKRVQSIVTEKLVDNYRITEEGIIRISLGHLEV